MGPVALALIGAGLGALKSTEEKNMWEDQQKAEAAKTRYAPWTGQWGRNLDTPTGDMANMMLGASAALGLGQQLSGKKMKLFDDSDEGKKSLYQMNGVDETRPPENLYRYQKEKRDRGYRLLDGDYRDYIDDGYSGTLYADKKRYSDPLSH
jgi:hypothetical protein